MSRRIVQAGTGVLRVEQRLRVGRREIGTDVSGPACVVAEVRAARGRVAYRRGETRVTAPAAFIVVIPPYSIVQAILEDADVMSTAFAFRPPGGLCLPRGPLLLPFDGVRPLTGISAAYERLAAPDDGLAVGRDAEPGSLAARAKRILDAEYAAPLQIRCVAGRLGVAPPAVSRAFNGAYGLPPIRYRHQIRIVDALLRFASGDVPATVFQDVGFDDLSRFYKIFRKVACAAPGTYRAAGARNAKT